MDDETSEEIPCPGCAALRAEVERLEECERELASIKMNLFAHYKEAIAPFRHKSESYICAAIRYFASIHARAEKAERALARLEAEECVEAAARQMVCGVTNQCDPCACFECDERVNLVAHLKLAAKVIRAALDKAREAE